MDDSAATNLNSDQFTVTIPGNLMTQIDAQVGAEFVDRNDFILAASRHYLDYLRSRGGDDMAVRG